MKRKTQLISGSVALVCLLVYTWWHTSQLLSRYIDQVWIAYVCAAGIELAVVALMLRIGDLKRLKAGHAFLLFTLIAAVSISAVANLVEGFRYKETAELTAGSLSRLDWVQWVVAIGSTSLISLLVMALSEVLGADVGAMIAAHERLERQKQKEDEAEQGATEALEELHEALAEAEARAERAEASARQLRHEAQAASRQAEAEAHEALTCRWCGYEAGSQQALYGHYSRCEARREALNEAGKPLTEDNGKPHEAVEEVRAAND